MRRVKMPDPIWTVPVVYASLVKNYGDPTCGSRSLGFIVIDTPFSLETEAGLYILSWKKQARTLNRL